MDKTAAERPPLRPSVPRLHLSTFNPETPPHFELESLQLTTCRSDASDFALPTSFRTSRGPSMDKIPTQLEKLNGLIDNMMDNLKEECKSVEDLRFASPEFTCQLTCLDSCTQQELERAQMMLEDACASEWRHREEKLELQRQLFDTQDRLALALHLGSSAADFKEQSSAAIQSQLQTLIAEAKCLGISVDDRKGSGKQESGATIETIVANELRALKRHIENLTGVRLNSLSGNWAVEIPAFCKNLVQVYSTCTVQRPKEEPSFDAFKDLMRVTCSAGDLQGVMHRVCEILEDLEESGTRKEFGIQLGKLGVTVAVEAEDVEESRCLPQEMGVAVSEQIACKRESFTDRLPEPPKPEVNSTAYIHQLEERLLDLQSALQLRDSVLAPDTMNLTSELESKLEEVMYKLALANKQIEKLKQGKYSPEEEKMSQNYKLKTAELVLKEETLKESTARLAVDREVLRMKEKQFEEERKKLQSEHQEAMLELTAAFETLHKETIDEGVQADCDSRLVELEATCKHLTVQLQEESNKSRLLASQHVMRKEEGQWIRPNSSKKLARQLEQLCNELDKGIAPARLKTIRNKVLKVKNSLEVLSTDSCEKKRETGGFGSLFSLSHEASESSDVSWPESPQSPDFSVSNIEEKQCEELRSELKQKESALQDADIKLQELQNRLSDVIRENEQLKEERLLHLKKSDEMEKLKKTIEEFMTVKVADAAKVEADRKELEQRIVAFQQEKEVFRQKRDLLREKVTLVNERQKKIQSKEKLLSEKEGILQLEEKKNAYHKQAVDQLWKENEEKRRELAKCQKVIEDEWKVLMEETKQFEALKVADRRVKDEWGPRGKELEEQADRLEELAEKLNREKDVLESEKNQLQEERALLEEERNRLAKSQKSLTDKLKRYTVQQSEATIDRLSIARQKKDIEAGQRDLALMIPALQKLLSPPVER